MPPQRVGVDECFRRDSDGTHFPATPLGRNKHKSQATPLQRLLRFLCSLSFIVAAIYYTFLSLIAVAVGTSTIKQTNLVLVDTWESVHATHVTNVELVIDSAAQRMLKTTTTAASLYTQSMYPVESNRTLTMLCAVLALADTHFDIRALSLGAFDVSQYSSCLHAEPTDPSPTNLTALVSTKGWFYGVYYINETTLTYDDPPVPKALTTQSWTMQAFIDGYKTRYTVFRRLDALGPNNTYRISIRDLWGMPAAQPSYLSFILPLAVLAPEIPLHTQARLTDFAQTRIDATSLVNTSLLTDPSVFVRAMVLMNHTLGSDDPKVLSNNWKQQVVFNPTYIVLQDYNTTYLSVSNITDPLMHEALKHVDLKLLKLDGSKQTVTFDYSGAPASVTAYIYTNDEGLSLPLVVVSPHYKVAGPYQIIFRSCTAVLAIVVFLLSVLFYFAIDRYLSRPLREVTAAMEASVERGVRQPVRGAACDVVQLAETRELACAYNAAMAQLRVVDAFVPDAVRATRRGGPSLREHYLTVVTVRVRAGSGAGGAGGAAYGGDVGVDTSALLRRHPGAGAAAGAGAGGDGVSGDRGRRGGGGLAALVNAVAEAATALTNSGPFASAASLSAFVAAVRELCEARGGTVHRAAPDECVLHFAANVRRVLRGSGAGSGGGAGAGAAVSDRSLAAAVERAADADARAGVECALCVSRWVEQQQQERGNANSNGNGDSSSNCVEAVPDVRVVVDSGVFVCGEYRAPGSEQTLCVALGRDVAGAVGHVPAAIGVRVAATGEAALRVRGGVGGSAGRGTAAAAAAAAACSSSPPPFPAAAAERGGFRVLPVEALRTGRAGLDGGAVTLYEVLPGAVDGDAAWLAYARCCFDGFECMVRGDYAGALRAYRGVGEICDLEPGLLPRCLSREAAHSSAVGGAVSVQVARLLRECERRVRAGSTAGYERVRHVPLGIDAVLAPRRTEQAPVASPAPVAVVGCPRKPPAATRCASQASRLRSSSVWRYVVSVSTADGVVRRAVGDLPPVVRDNWGMEWRFPRSANNAGCGQLWVHPHTALGSAGTLCTVASFVLREGSGMFRKAMAAALDGAMSDELRSALPVWVASDAVRDKAERLFRLRHSLGHRQQLQPLSYSFDVEGCLLVFWEFCPSGTLRDVVRRYSFLSRVTTRRFAHSILSSIDELHTRGLAHGFLSLDAVKVGADGVCRLCSGTTDFKGDSEVFLLSRTCYVSPQMAAGSPPTAACDMFCCGLLLVEMLSRGPAWAWAAVPEGSAPHGTQEELAALMAEGGQAFSAAVVDGRVVPAVSVSSSRQPQLQFSDDFLLLLRSLLSYEASARPTATQACEAVGQTLVE